MMSYFIGVTHARARTSASVYFLNFQFAFIDLLFCPFFLTQKADRKFFSRNVVFALLLYSSSLVVVVCNLITITARASRFPTAAEAAG